MLFENDVVRMEKAGTFTFEESRNLRTLNVNVEDAPYSAIAEFTKYIPKLIDRANQDFHHSLANLTRRYGNALRR